MTTFDVNPRQARGPIGLLLHMMPTSRARRLLRAAVAATIATVPLSTARVAAQDSSAPPVVHAEKDSDSSVPAGASLPTYVIGPGDVLAIVFWRDKDMSADVLVRPDGHITLPLLNDIAAAGLTPPQLRDRILTEARRYLEDPSPTVVVKEIHSRLVFITGQVEKPGSYPLAAPTTVLQLIAMAGGLKEYADGRNILVTRNDNGRQAAYVFDYQELLKRKNFRQNIELRPGDTVVVP
jgi:polysaccharide biosynthesis/export protein